MSLAGAREGSSLQRGEGGEAGISGGVGSATVRPHLERESAGGGSL